jgi:hypothetical protein
MWPRLVEWLVTPCNMEKAEKVYMLFYFLLGEGKWRDFLESSAMILTSTCNLFLLA